MASKQDVSFGINPTAIIAPDVAAQQLDLSRRQAIADALRMQSLSPIEAERGSISWTQGISKLASALAARSEQKKINADTIKLGRLFADRVMGRTPGINGDAATGGPTADQTGIVSHGTFSPPTQPMAPQGNSLGIPSLSGDQQRDAFNFAVAPDTYMEKVIGADAPTDFARSLVQAGIPQGSPLFRQLMQSQVAKQNYIAPLTGRPGSTIRDPNDPSQILGYDLPTVEGAIPVYGKNGEPQGYRAAPGAAAITGQMEGAKAGAKAAAEAPFGVVQVWNPQTGQMELRPKSAVTGDGQRGPQGAGPISGALGAAPPLGLPPAANAYGSYSGKAFGDIQTAASESPSRMQALREMGTLLDKGLTTGPAQQKFREAAQSMGVPGIIDDNAAEFNKWASQYSARSASELGLSGSDSRVDLTVHATPNGGMPTGAARTIISQMYGIEAAKSARANAANSWLKSHGPQDIAGFETAWRQVYDPKMFEVLQWSPTARNKWLSQQGKAKQDDFARRYDILASMGALP